MPDPHELPISPVADRPTGTAMRVARIVEADCIGCTKCIRACPFDSISGASKLMHAVLGDRCTGCELCLPPCPTDCIVMEPVERTWTAAEADDAERRRVARLARLQREERATLERKLDKARAKLAAIDVEAAGRGAGRPARGAESGQVPAGAEDPAIRPPGAATPPVAEDPADARRRAIVAAAIERARARLG